jgi:hypothetical protein
MTERAWLTTDHPLVPGTEIFRADRCFQLWQHTASHSQTLLRSPRGTDLLGRTYDTRIDVLFKPITVMKIRQDYDDLVIRVATQDEAAAIRSDSPSARYYSESRVFILESAGETDYVVAAAVCWHEDRLGFEAPSSFAGYDSDTPNWERNPLFRVDGGLGGKVASAHLRGDPCRTTLRPAARPSPPSPEPPRPSGC